MLQPSGVTMETQMTRSSVTTQQSQQYPENTDSTLINPGELN